MYQGMTEAVKSTLLGELQSIESWFCYEFQFDYDENLVWEKDYIYESLFAPIAWGLSAGTPARFRCGWKTCAKYPTARKMQDGRWIV